MKRVKTIFYSLQEVLTKVIDHTIYCTHFVLYMYEYMCQLLCDENWITWITYTNVLYCYENVPQFSQHTWPHWYHTIILYMKQIIYFFRKLAGFAPKMFFSFWSFSLCNAFFPQLVIFVEKTDKKHWMFTL